MRERERERVDRAAGQSRREAFAIGVVDSTATAAAHGEGRGIVGGRRATSAHLPVGRYRLLPDQLRDVGRRVVLAARPIALWVVGAWGGPDHCPHTVHGEGPPIVGKRRVFVRARPSRTAGCTARGVSGRGEGPPIAGRAPVTPARPLVGRQGVFPRRRFMGRDRVLIEPRSAGERPPIVGKGGVTSRRPFWQSPLHRKGAADAWGGGPYCGEGPRNFAPVDALGRWAITRRCAVTLWGVSP